MSATSKPDDIYKKIKIDCVGNCDTRYLHPITQIRGCVSGAAQV